MIVYMLPARLSVAFLEELQLAKTWWLQDAFSICVLYALLRVFKQEPPWWSSGRRQNGSDSREVPSGYVTVPSILTTTTQKRHM